MLSVCLINYFIDPNQIYNFRNTSSETKKFVNKMINSKELIMPNIDINEREMKKSLAYIATDKNCAVLGSSHIAQIRSDMISTSFRKICTSLINLGVSGGSIEDIFIFSEILLNKSSPPKTIIIEIAPWTFNYGRDRRWYSNKNIFYNMKLRLADGSEDLHINKQNYIPLFALLKNLFNKDYFISSLNLIYEKLKKKFLKEKYNFNTDTSFNKEGATILSKNYHEQHKYDKFKDYSTDSYKITKNSWTQDLAVDEFNKFVKILKEKFNIVLLMTPYHPDVFKKKGQPVLTAIKIVEETVHEIANKNNLQVIGSFYPEFSNCDKYEFWNSNHAKTTCLKKLKIQKQLN
ncbi:hypothetical protein OAJ46_00500 [Candidatus Pelagibacter sp.]|nr:hypothetical protein [Candidatus Pelagibacter sp.]